MGKIIPEVELVARTLYAYNYCAGAKASEAPWPPRNKSQMMHYLNLGEAVIKAQREAACVVDISRCAGLQRALTDTGSVT